MKIKREFFMALFCGLLILITGVNVYYNILDDLFAQDALNDRFAEVSRIIKRAAYRKKLNRNITEMKSGLKDFYGNVPLRKNYPEIVEKLHRAGRRNGVFVKVTNLTPFREFNGAPGFEVLGMKMPVKGSYRAIRTFISDVEGMRGMVGLNHVKMVEKQVNSGELSSKGRKSAQVDLELGFSLFFRKDLPSKKNEKPGGRNG